MRQIEFSSPGGPEVLRLGEGPIPAPKSGEVLIRVYAAGVNRPDLSQRQGTYPPPPGASPILGLEVSGVVEAIGDRSSTDDATFNGAGLPIRIGDQVCALVPGGGYAEYCVAPASHCLPVPTGLTYHEAAGIPETAFTVWANIFQSAHFKTSERLLIHGGSSGIGTTAIQFAKARGSEVYVTAGSLEKCHACLAIGATAAINYRQTDFEAEIKALTSGEGVDVILDMVGGDYTEKNLRLLRIDGRLVQIATQKGAKVQIDLREIMKKRLVLTGSTMRPRTVPEKAKIARELFQEIWPLYATRKIQVLISQVFPLEEAAKAHALLESGQAIGKIILAVAR